MARLKRQYGRERWRRYLKLRRDGFTKSESREFSRFDKGDIVIKRMVKTRIDLVEQFKKVAKAKGWTGNKREYEWNNGLRKWYLSKGFTTKGALGVPVGSPSPYEWYRDTLDKVARQISDDPEALKKKKTPPRKGKKVKEMRARSKRRAKAH